MPEFSDNPLEVIRHHVQVNDRLLVETGGRAAVREWCQAQIGQLRANRDFFEDPAGFFHLVEAYFAADLPLAVHASSHPSGSLVLGLVKITDDFRVYQARAIAAMRVGSAIEPVTPELANSMQEVYARQTELDWQPELDFGLKGLLEAEA